MQDPKLLGPGDLGKHTPSFSSLLAQKVDPLSFGVLRPDQFLYAMAPTL